MKINYHLDDSIQEDHIEIYAKKLTPNISKLIQALDDDKDILWCNSNNLISPINYQDIYAIYAASHGVSVITENASYSYHENLSNLKTKLPNDFLEASRSAIFNFHKIDHLELLDNGAIDVILQNKQRVQISRRKIKVLKERLGL